MATILQNMGTITITTHKLQITIPLSKEEQINIQVQLISLLLHFRILGLTLILQVTHITMLVVTRLRQDMQPTTTITRMTHTTMEAQEIIMLSHTRTTHSLVLMQSKIPVQCLPILSHISRSTTSGHTITITLHQVLLSIQLLGAVT
jgi:hypothetical protein